MLKVTAILKDISSKDHSFFFAQLRSEAKEGPFGKVKVRYVLSGSKSELTNRPSWKAHIHHMSADAL